jgi:hypothetical protein
VDDVDQGGSFLITMRAGVGNASGDIDPVEIAADEHVGGSTGEDDIVASGSITDLRVISGFAQSTAGDVRIDILAGVTNASTVGGLYIPLVINQTTGAVTGGSFDGAGAMSHIIVRADGNVGLSSGANQYLNNFAADDGITDMEVVAEGEAITVDTAFVSIGDTGGETTQNIFVDVIADANPSEFSTFGINDLDLFADTSVGASVAGYLEGYNVVRADGPLTAISIDAGLGDGASGDEDGITEEILVNVLAGMEVGNLAGYLVNDHTVVMIGSTISGLTMNADDNIGALGQAIRNGVQATGDVSGFTANAGGDSRSVGPVTGTGLDRGGAFLIDIAAGVGDNTSATTGSILSTTIRADGNVGEAGAVGSGGLNDFVAEENITGVNIYAGFASAVGSVNGIGNALVDILAGRTVGTLALAAVIDQLTGVTSAFDAAGYIDNLQVQADGNIGTTDGQTDIAAATYIGAGDPLSGLTPFNVVLLADGAARALNPAGGTSAGVAMSVTASGDAAQNNQNIFVDVVAGAEETLAATTNVITGLAMAADGMIGAGTSGKAGNGVTGTAGSDDEGYNVVRADGAVTYVEIDAGLGDNTTTTPATSEDGIVEDILVDLFSGLEVDGTTLSLTGLAAATSDIGTTTGLFSGTTFNVLLLSDDNIGAFSQEAPPSTTLEGIRSANNIRYFGAFAGGDARNGLSDGSVDQGGNYWVDTVAGVSGLGIVIDGSPGIIYGTIDPTVIVADQDVGASSGVNDIVADTNIIDLTVIAGFGSTLSGNVNVDILAGIQNAKVGTVIDQTTGAVTPASDTTVPQVFDPGVFDTTGYIQDAVVRADGNVGTTDGLRNIATAGNIINLAVIAEGVEILGSDVTKTFALVGSPTVGGNQILGYQGLGDNALAGDQNVYVDIMAGADNLDDNVTNTKFPGQVDPLSGGANSINGLVVLADGRIGLPYPVTSQEGYNIIRADGNITGQSGGLDLIIFAGLNDTTSADYGNEGAVEVIDETIYVNIFAGFEVDGTAVNILPQTNLFTGYVSSDPGDPSIIGLRLFTDDNLGTEDSPITAAEDDGIFASGNIVDVQIMAGTGSFSGATLSGVDITIGSNLIATASPNELGGLFNINPDVDNIFETEKYGGNIWVDIIAGKTSFGIQDVGYYQGGRNDGTLGALETSAAGYDFTSPASGPGVASNVSFIAGDSDVGQQADGEGYNTIRAANDIQGLTVRAGSPMAVNSPLANLQANMTKAGSAPISGNIFTDIIAGFVSNDPGATPTDLPSLLGGSIVASNFLAESDIGTISQAADGISVGFGTGGYGKIGTEGLILARDSILATSIQAGGGTTYAGAGPFVAASALDCDGSYYLSVGSVVDNITSVQGNDVYGDILVNIVAQRDSISGASVGIGATPATVATRILADNDIGVGAETKDVFGNLAPAGAASEGYNFIFASKNIGANALGVNNATDNDADATPAGFNVFIDAGNANATTFGTALDANYAGIVGDIFADIIADTGSIDDVLVSADGDIGQAVQTGDPSLTTSRGVIRAGSSIEDTLIQAGLGTQNRGNERGDLIKTGALEASILQGNLYYNVIAGFNVVNINVGNPFGSISSAIIEADWDIGAATLETPEGMNLVFALNNIGFDNGTPNIVPSDNPNFSGGGQIGTGYNIRIDAGNADLRNFLLGPDQVAGTPDDRIPGGSEDSDILVDIIAERGNIADVAITADSDIGAYGQKLGSAVTMSVAASEFVPSPAGPFVTFTVEADQIDTATSAGGFYTSLNTVDNPNGIIQAGDFIELLYISAGEKASADDTRPVTGGSFLMSIFAGADGLEAEFVNAIGATVSVGANIHVRDLVKNDGSPNTNGTLATNRVGGLYDDIVPTGGDTGNGYRTIYRFDGINGLTLMADDDLGQVTGNIISAADSIDITALEAGLNLVTPGLDPGNTELGYPNGPDSAGDIHIDIVAGTRLTSGEPVTGITGIDPAVLVDSGLPFSQNINDANLPGVETLVNDDDDITILRLSAAEEGMFVPDYPGTEDLVEGNGNLQGTFVASANLTILDAFINGNMVGNDGVPGGRALVAGASYTGEGSFFTPANPPVENFLTIQMQIEGTITGPLSVGAFVPFNMFDDEAIGTDAGGPFQAGTVLTLGTIQGELSVGRMDSRWQGVHGVDVDDDGIDEPNGITFEEVLAGQESLADNNFLPRGTIAATNDIRLDFTIMGRPFFNPQQALGSEIRDAGDGDLVAGSIYAFGDIENDSFFTGTVQTPVTINDIKDGDISLVHNALGNVIAYGIAAADALNINFIMANVDAVTAIDTGFFGGTGVPGDPSTPSTRLPLNFADGDLSANILALGAGNGIGEADYVDTDNDGVTDEPDEFALPGISGGHISAGLDPFVLLNTDPDTNGGIIGLPANPIPPPPGTMPNGVTIQQPAVAGFAEAWGFGSITGVIGAFDSDPTDGMESGDITVTFIGAGEHIGAATPGGTEGGKVAIFAQDDIALAGSAAGDISDGSTPLLRGPLFPDTDIDIAAGLSSFAALSRFGTTGDGTGSEQIADLFPGGSIRQAIVAGDDILAQDKDPQGEPELHLLIVAQGSGLSGTGNVSDLMTGVEDQIDDVLFNSASNSQALVRGIGDDSDPVGSLGTNIYAYVLASNSVGLINVGDVLGAHGGMARSVGTFVGMPNAAILGQSTHTGSYTGSFEGVVIAGAGVDLLIDNSDADAEVNRDNLLVGSGNFAGVVADGNVTFKTDAELGGVTMDGLVATGSVSIIAAGFDGLGPNADNSSGNITGDITVGRNLNIIVATDSVGTSDDLIAVGQTLGLVQAGDVTSVFGVQVPTSLPGSLGGVPRQDSYGDIVADFIVGGTTTSINLTGPTDAGMGIFAPTLKDFLKSQTSTDTGSGGNDVVAGFLAGDEIQSDIFLGAFDRDIHGHDPIQIGGQVNPLVFAEGGKDAIITFPSDARAFVRITGGDLNTLDIVLAGTSSGQDVISGSITTAPTAAIYTHTPTDHDHDFEFDIDEIVSADDFSGTITIDQGGLGRFVVDDDAINRYAGEWAINALDAPDAENATMPALPGILDQIAIRNELSAISLRFNSDTGVDQASDIDFADFSGTVTTRDNLGFDPAPGQPGIIIEGNFEGTPGDPAILQSILRSVDDVFVGVDVDDAAIYAMAPGGMIGDLFVGDDIEDIRMIAHTLIGNPVTKLSASLDLDPNSPDETPFNWIYSITTQDKISTTNDGDITVIDSIMANDEDGVHIEAISGSILDILVGTQPDLIGGPNESPYPLSDPDGKGIDGGGNDDGVVILAEQNIGNIKVIYGNIANGVEVETYETFGGSIGNIEVVNGNIENDVRFVADKDIRNITVGMGPLTGYGDIENDVEIISRFGGIGNITAYNDIQDEVYIGAGKGGIGEIRAYDDLENGVTIETYHETYGNLAGLYVGDYIRDGVDIDINGDILELTENTIIGNVTGAVLVGASVEGDVSISGRSIGAEGNGLVVGITGVGSVDPDGSIINIYAINDIGDITVRDTLGGNGVINITSATGSIGDLVAGTIHAGTGTHYINIINPGSDNILDSVVAGIPPAGDDYVSGGTIVPGTNNVVNTIKAGDDVYTYGITKIGIAAGPDGILQSVTALLSDDVYTYIGLVKTGIAVGLNGNLDSVTALLSDDVYIHPVTTITAGTDGILQSAANLSVDDKISGGTVQPGANGLLQTLPLGNDTITTQPIQGVGSINVHANLAIGDIVALFDGLSGIRGLHLQVDSAFGRIGDLISQGDVTTSDIENIIDLATFQGSIGDIVSLFGSVSLSNATFGGSLGDIYAAKFVDINNLVLENGSLAADGTIDPLLELPVEERDVSLDLDTQEVQVKDALLRPRFDGAPEDGITSEIDYVDIDDIRVHDNIGPITAFKDVTLDDIQVGGDIGDIESVDANVYIAGVSGGSDFHVVGNVGNITAFLDLTIGNGEDDKVSIGGNLGKITSQTADVTINDIFVKGTGDEEIPAVGDITASVEVDIVNLDTGGSVGKITSLTDFVYIEDDSDIAGSIGDITAFDGVEIYGLQVGRDSLGAGIGNIASPAGYVYITGTVVGGNVKDITALTDIYFLDSMIDSDYYNFGLKVGGSVGDVESITGSIVSSGGLSVSGIAAIGLITDPGLVVHGSIGAIIASEDIKGIFVAETGDIGHRENGTLYAGVTSYAGDIGEYNQSINAYPGFLNDLIYDLPTKFIAGGSIGDVVALSGSIIDSSVTIHANQNIGDIYASKDIMGETDASGGTDVIITAETGNIGDGSVYVGKETIARTNLPGGIVSATGDILAIIHAGGDIYDVRAMKPSFLLPTDPESLIPGGNILDGTRITAGQDIGDFAGGRGVIAGGVIEDDVAIIAGNNIGVVEAKIIGFGYESLVEEVIETSETVTETIEISLIKIQVPDNDGRLDMNDYLMFTDSNGDDFIDIPWELSQAIAGVNLEHWVSGEGSNGHYEEGYVPILADCKISNPEFDLIVDWWGRNDVIPNLPKDLPSLPDWYNSGVLRFGEVEVEDVDNIIILKLEGYYDQFDADGDGRPDGIYLDTNDNKTFDDPATESGGGDTIVTFNYDVPNLPLVFIDHIQVESSHVETTTETITVVDEPAALMTIVAQGEDPEGGRAIGRIVATHDIYANVLIEASRGGIGSIIASHDIGAVGSTETIEINAWTAIDTIEAGRNLGRPGVPIVLNVMGSPWYEGTGEPPTLPIEVDSQGNIVVDMEGTWLETNGVGVKGGIIAGSGDIYMNINTGGSIGAIEARTGKVVGEYHATGNLKSVFGSRGVDGDFVAELGSTEYILAMAGDIKGSFTTGGDLTSVHSTGNIIADFTVGGMLTQISTTKLNGKIEGEIVAVEGIGIISAPFGNVLGSIYTGGNIGEIVESLKAAKGDIDISLKLVEGDTSYISALNTTFALSDPTGNPYVYIITNDQFTGIGTIQIKGSTSTTSFAITTDGGLFELDKFLVTGNFGSLSDTAGGGADASIDTVKISGSVSGSLAVDGDIGTLTIGGGAKSISAGNIGTASIKGTISGTVEAGVIGTISAGGLGEDGGISTGVLSGSTFTYTVGGATDSVSVVGGNWHVSLDVSNEIDASLTKILAQHLSFTTTSSVDDLSADLSDRDLSLIIGGDILGDITIHSGDLSVQANDLRGKIAVTAGAIESIDLKGSIFASADAKADGGIHGFHVGGNIPPSIGVHTLLNTNPDDNPNLAGDQDTIPDHITLTTGQVVSIEGSSTTLTADVTVVFGSLVNNIDISKSGSLILSSTSTPTPTSSGMAGRCNVGEINVTNGSKITVKSIFVDGDLGGFINTNVKAKVANITATGDIGKVTAYGSIQKIQAGGSIGEIRSLWDSITNINAGGRIDEIFSAKNIKTVVADEIGTIDGGDKGAISNITARGRIDQIKTMKTVKTISAGEIGIIQGGDAGSVSNVMVLGDIDLINGKTVSNVYAGGKLKVTAAGKASKISSGFTGPAGTFPGGLVEVGVGYSKISPNIEVIVRPPQSQTP